jgi:hypothetical protein
MQFQQPGTPLKFQILAQWKGPQEVTPSDSVADAVTTAATTASINEKAAP